MRTSELFQSVDFGHQEDEGIEGAENKSSSIGRGVLAISKNVAEKLADTFANGGSFTKAAMITGGVVAVAAIIATVVTVVILATAVVAIAVTIGMPVLAALKCVVSLTQASYHTVMVGIHAAIRIAKQIFGKCVKYEDEKMSSHYHAAVDHLIGARMLAKLTIPIAGIVWVLRTEKSLGFEKFKRVYENDVEGVDSDLIDVTVDGDIAKEYCENNEEQPSILKSLQPNELAELLKKGQFFEK